MFECLTKGAKIVVKSGGEALAFLIEDPAAVVMRSGDGREVEFTCGPQKGRKIVVHYDAKPDAKLGTAGVVRELEFE